MVLSLLLENKKVHTSTGTMKWSCEAGRHGVFYSVSLDEHHLWILLDFCGSREHGCYEFAWHFLLYHGMWIVGAKLQAFWGNH